MFRTPHDMIVHQSRCLHESIHDGRADEAESSLLQILAQRARFFRFGWEILAVSYTVVERLAADETPDVLVERTKLFLNLQKSLRIAHGRFDLGAIAHDTGIGKDLFNARRRHTRDFHGIEIVEELAIVLAFAQNRLPTQAGLRALERDEFEERPVVVDRTPPLLVVILYRELTGRPGATTAQSVCNDASNAFKNSLTSSLLKISGGWMRNTLPQRPPLPSSTPRSRIASSMRFVDGAS